MPAGIALDSAASLARQTQDLLASLASDSEPGFAVGVYSAGELVAAAAAGCAISEHGVPITEHTVFEIASASKHITAACLLLLASDGRIDLDADIRGWLPELALRHPVTPRQCLTHTGGLRDYLALCDVAGVPVAGIDEARAMNLIAGQRDLDFPQGSAFSYSNTGYVLAAALVRRITGTSLARFASERVFGALGMAATGFRDDVGVPVRRLAGGYLAVPAGARPTGFRRADVTENVVGDGGCVTSVADLARWHAFMTSGAVLGSEIRDGLLAGQVLADGTAAGYALGLAAVEVGGEAAWWHSGSWAGYRSAVLYLPTSGAGVTVLANRNDRYASHIAAAVAAALVTGADVRTCYETAAGAGMPGEQAIRAAAEVAGLWHAPELDLFAEFQARDGRLVAPEQDGEQVYCLGTDGRWHGAGTASGATFTVRGGELAAGWGLSAGLQDRYVRADAGSRRPAVRGVPCGFFVNEELRAHAGIQAGVSRAEITIGFAAARSLLPAGPGVWRATTGGALTVRLAADGAGLLISVPGAHHLRFRPTAEPEDLALPRGQ